MKASWSSFLSTGTAFALALADAINATSGTVEMDLVFPRNDTYAPTPLLPIVFAFQNSELAQFLNPTISFTVWDRNNMSDTVVTTEYDTRWANFSSSDPYFAYRGFTAFNQEGTWMLVWTITWDSCTKETLNSLFDDSDAITTNITDNRIIFTTMASAQEADLVAATTSSSRSNETCALDTGIAVNVTDTLEVSSAVDWSGGDTCAVVASSNTVSSDPCRVSLGSAAASSISASVTAQACKGLSVPPVGINCTTEDDDKESAATERLMVGGLVYLVAGLGAIRCILV